MLAFFTIVIMLAVGYAFMVEGLFTACTMCVNVFLAGVLAFNFYEPLAVLLEDWLPASFITDPTSSYADALCIVLIFSLALFGLRSLTNQLANIEIDFPQLPQRIGGAVFGLITGYLVSGVLVCAFQTLPLHVNFMGFDPTMEEAQPMRRVLPPDRVWLALMRRAGLYAFSNATEETFDPDATFELRYARYRRYDESRTPQPYPLPYYGEFGGEVKSSTSGGAGQPILPGMPAPTTSGPALPQQGGPTAPDKGK